MRGPADRSENRRRSPGLLAGLGAMLLAASALLAADDAAAVVSQGNHSCFLNGIAHTAPSEGQAIERATIFIALVGSDGSLVSQGTGFVAAGSAGKTRESRIVTAAHVVEHEKEIADGARLMAFFSDGAVIGSLRLVAAAPKHALAIGDFAILADDVAVVEIAQFVDQRTRGRFARLRGLPIAGDDAIRVGEASDPIGAIWGFSGAAAVDDKGRVVGVLTGASFRGRVTMELGSVQEANAAGVPVTRSVTLPTRSLIVVEPLHAAAIEAALGAAPIIESAPASAAVVLAGFPLASCASTSARLESVATKAGLDLLSRWQRVGPVDAWFLQPPLDQTKLRLTP